MLKGTRVDGVYTADPEKDPAATKFDEITFEEVLDRRLKVMDLTAFTLCRENGLRIIVFDMDTAGNLGKVLAGEKIGTLVKLIRLWQHKKSNKSAVGDAGADRRDHRRHPAAALRAATATPRRAPRRTPNRQRS